MNLILQEDASCASAPAGFQNDVAFLESWFDSRFADSPITLEIDVGFGECAGAPLPSGALGESQVAQWLSFNYLTQVVPALATYLYDNGVPFPYFPPNTADGSGIVDLTVTQATELGLLPNNPVFGGYIGIASVPFLDYGRGTPPGNKYDAFGIFTHEITEVMGRDDTPGTPYTTIEDLFRYLSPGILLDEQGGDFSTNDGNTPQAYYNTNPAGDPGDWNGANPNDPFNAYTNPGTYTSALTAADQSVMTNIGFIWTGPSGGSDLATHNFHHL